MAQYLTLEQAAQTLQVSVDRLKEMVKKNEVRGFQDRGTLRFRSQDIEEKARQLGLGSDPELTLGDAALNPGSGPGSSVRKRTKTTSPTSPRSGLGKKPSRVDPPKAASDSDIRLVSDTSDQDFNLDAEEASGPRSGTKPASDSGALILPLDGDSDVKLETDTPSDEEVPNRPGAKSPSDSDIRLEEVAKAKSRGKDLVTEEIDLDAEEAAARKSPPPSRPRPGSSGKQPALPTSSPFELSESDLELEPLQDKQPANQGVESSSDFNLAPMGESDELPVLDDDSVSLGELSTSGPARSGINLQDPGDSGISLEQGGSDELDIGLAPVTDKSAGEAEQGVDSSSEFELSLDDEEGDSSSEFELTLDDDSSAVHAPANSDSDSDSEFELTLDEEGDLTPADETDALADDEEGKDIFEPTDFDVPALDDESASEAVALNDMGDEGSSEFDLDLDEEGLNDSDDAEEGGVAFDEDEDAPEGGVVDVGDEDADEAAETISRPVKSRRRTAVVEEDEEEDPYAGLGEDEEEPEEEEEEEARPTSAAAAPLPPADWGLFPALALLPTVVILFVVGLMTFELSRTMLGYRGTPGVSGSLILQPLAKKLDPTLPDK